MNPTSLICRSILRVFAIVALMSGLAINAFADASMLGRARTILPGRSETITIHPDRENTLASTIDGIAQWRILPGAMVQIHLGDGTYKIDRTLRIDHPDGVRIQIVGNTSAPEKVRLVWPAKTDGVYVGTGAALGRLDGVTILRETPGGNDNGARDNASGLLAENAGVLQVGPAVVVDGFYYGAQARYGGVIRARAVQVRHAGDAGFFAYNGGHIEAQESSAVDAHDAKLALGSGYVAEYGGTLDASGASAQNNALAGFTALSSGAIVANDARAMGNTQYGFYALTNGAIVAHRAAALSSGRQASFSQGGGSITGLGER
ncbi:hypothetical protein [Burkholderia cenocepacia]|uniref:hypothetical protein n=1 Tax=Burkholderia cenocepacia TaxID=95486 RepID=UPI0028B44017|nr:hypothetical protein [Burkholderia cenocepacia]MDT6992273.1 hypothetical protein [Burkholderia cenocepacia]